MADDTFRTIVVGSDGSAGAAKAVAWAATLGAQTQWTNYPPGNTPGVRAGHDFVATAAGEEERGGQEQAAQEERILPSAQGVS